MSKQAVIQAGSSQYIVSKDDVIDIDFQPEKKSIDFEVLAVIDGDKTQVGAPTVGGAKVKGSVVEEKVAGEKVTAIRYKAKKGVDKRRGHRQLHTRVKITSIS